MRARELLMALIVAMVTVTACKPDKTPLPPPGDHENPFVIFNKGGPMYGVVTGLNGKRFLIQADTVFQCNDANTVCSLQVAGCPSCAVCDCTQVKCIKWCSQPPVIEKAAPPNGPGVQPAPTAPK